MILKVQFFTVGRVNKMSHCFEKIRFAFNRVTTLGYEQCTVVSTFNWQLMQLFQRSSKAFWCLNLVKRDFYQSSSDMRNKTRGWLWKYIFFSILFLIRNTKHLKLSDCHCKALIKTMFSRSNVGPAAVVTFSDSCNLERAIMKRILLFSWHGNLHA